MFSTLQLSTNTLNSIHQFFPGVDVVLFLGEELTTFFLLGV
jgi:hypothetical protein